MLTDTVILTLLLLVVLFFPKVIPAGVTTVKKGKKEVLLTAKGLQNPSMIIDAHLCVRERKDIFYVVLYLT